MSVVTQPQWHEPPSDQPYTSLNSRPRVLAALDVQVDTGIHSVDAGNHRE